LLAGDSLALFRKLLFYLLLNRLLGIFEVFGPGHKLLLALLEIGFLPGRFRLELSPQPFENGLFDGSR
jgi:hypothetical protein